MPRAESGLSWMGSSWPPSRGRRLTCLAIQDYNSVFLSICTPLSANLTFISKNASLLDFSFNHHCFVMLIVLSDTHSSIVWLRLDTPPRLSAYCQPDNAKMFAPGISWLHLPKLSERHALNCVLDQHGVIHSHATGVLSLFLRRHVAPLFFLLLSTKVFGLFKICSSLHYSFDSIQLVHSSFLIIPLSVESCFTLCHCCI